MRGRGANISRNESEAAVDWGGDLNIKIEIEFSARLGGKFVSEKKGEKCL